MSLLSLDHVQLAMPLGKEGLARSFFVGLLGMIEEEKPLPLRERGGVWFRFERTVVHVGVEVDFKPQRKAHPAFVVDDLDDLASRLRFDGFEVRWDNSLPKIRRFFTTDPFGNRIEFLLDGHGFTQAEPRPVAVEIS